MKWISATASRHVAAPVEQVWAIISDFRLDYGWRQGLVSVTQHGTGSADVGTGVDDISVVMWQPLRTSAVVTEVVPQRRIAWRSTAGTPAMGARTVLDDGKGGCSVELSMRSHVPGSIEWMLRPFVARAVRQSLARSLERLGVLAELREFSAIAA